MIELYKCLCLPSPPQTFALHDFQRRIKIGFVLCFDLHSSVILKQDYLFAIVGLAFLPGHLVHIVELTIEGWKLGETFWHQTSIRAECVAGRTIARGWSNDPWYLYIFTCYVQQMPVVIKWPSFSLTSRQ